MGHKTGEDWAMHKTILIAALAAGVALSAAVEAQPYGGGYGMMGGYGPGYMMGPGYGQGYGPGYMMGPGYGPGYMMGPGYGPGWMMNGYRGGYGPGMMGYGPGYQGDMQLSTDQVKNYLAHMIRNPNLTVGEVKEKDADIIVAEIVTKQGNQLVQKLDFNRHTGYVQPEE
jgi:hypothetical protein